MDGLDIILGMLTGDIMNNSLQEQKEQKEKEKEALVESHCAILQGILDDNKQEIPDSLYLKLCNALMDENKKEHKYKFYEVYYVYTKSRRISQDRIDLSIVPNKRILRVNTHLFDRWRVETRDGDEKHHFSLYIYLKKCLCSINNELEILEHTGCNGEDHMDIEVMGDCHLISYEELGTRN
jgi:hypothetical protein